MNVDPRDAQVKRLEAEVAALREALREADYLLDVWSTGDDCTCDEAERGTGSGDDPEMGCLFCRTCDSETDVARLLSDTEATARAYRDSVIEETMQRAIRLARGCKDYGGGYRSDDGQLSAFHHGMDTVVNVLTAALEQGEKPSLQVRMVERFGREDGGR